jgi:hypothetical protein
MNRDESTRIEEALERLNVIERRVEVMQVRQEFGQAAVLSAQADVKEIKEDVKILVDRVHDNRLEYWKTGGFAAAITLFLNALGWKVNQ